MAKCLKSVPVSHSAGGSGGRWPAGGGPPAREDEDGAGRLSDSRCEGGHMRRTWRRRRKMAAATAEAAMEDFQATKTSADGGGCSAWKRRRWAPLYGGVWIDPLRLICMCAGVNPSTQLGMENKTRKKKRMALNKQFLFSVQNAKNHLNWLATLWRLCTILCPFQNIAIFRSNRD